MSLLSLPRISPGRPYAFPASIEMDVLRLRAVKVSARRSEESAARENSATNEEQVPKIPFSEESDLERSSWAKLYHREDAEQVLTFITAS